MVEERRKAELAAKKSHVYTKKASAPKKLKSNSTSESEKLPGSLGFGESEGSTADYDDVSDAAALGSSSDSSSGLDFITSSGVTLASGLGFGKGGNLFTEELAKNDVLVPEKDENSKKADRKSETEGKEDDDDSSGSGVDIEFGSAEMSDSDKEGSVSFSLKGIQF